MRGRNEIQRPYLSRIATWLHGHSLNKPMHDTRHILGILSGLWTTTRLQWQVPNIVLEQTSNISNS